MLQKEKDSEGHLWWDGNDGWRFHHTSTISLILAAHGWLLSSRPIIMTQSMGAKAKDRWTPLAVDCAQLPKYCRKRPWPKHDLHRSPCLMTPCLLLYDIHEPEPKEKVHNCHQLSTISLLQLDGFWWSFWDGQWMYGHFDHLRLLCSSLILSIHCVWRQGHTHPEMLLRSWRAKKRLWLCSLDASSCQQQVGSEIDHRPECSI